MIEATGQAIATIAPTTKAEVAAMVSRKAVTLTPFRSWSLV